MTRYLGSLLWDAIVPRHQCHKEHGTCRLRDTGLHAGNEGFMIYLISTLYMGK